MHTARILAAAALAALVIAPASAKLTREERAEARLAKVLDGRIAGEPARCIRDFAQEGMEVIDDVGFVFRRGDALWLNRPTAGTFVDDSDIAVIEKWNGSQLCEHDRVEMRDRISLMPGPVVMLGEFVPYTRTDKGAS